MRTTKPAFTLQIDNIPIAIYRKKIKHTYLSIRRSDGQVRLSVPKYINEEKLREFIQRKLSWIHHHRKKIATMLPPQPYSYTTGEQHYFLGEAYTLQVIHTKQKPFKVVEDQNNLLLYASEGATRTQKEKILDTFYRKAIQTRIPLLIEKWSTCMGVIPYQVRIRKMKTRWGTCIPGKKRIWLNLCLAKYAPHLLEYIFVHEMVHFFEKNHGKHFQALMTTFLPPWQTYKAELRECQP